MDDRRNTFIISSAPLCTSTTNVATPIVCTTTTITTTAAKFTCKFPRSSSPQLSSARMSSGIQQSETEDRVFSEYHSSDEDDSESTYERKKISFMSPTASSLLLLDNEHTAHLSGDDRMQGLHHRSRIKDEKEMLEKYEEDTATSSTGRRGPKESCRRKRTSSNSSLSPSSPSVATSSSSSSPSRFLLTFLSSCHLVEVTSRLVVALAMTFLILAHVMPGAYCSSSTMSVYSSSSAAAAAAASSIASTKRAFFNQTLLAQTTSNNLNINHNMKIYKMFQPLSSSSLLASSSELNGGGNGGGAGASHHHQRNWLKTRWPMTAKSLSFVSDKDEAERNGDLVHNNENFSEVGGERVVGMGNGNNKLYSNQLGVNKKNNDYVDNQQNDIVTLSNKSNNNNNNNNLNGNNKSAKTDLIVTSDKVEEKSSISDKANNNNNNYDYYNNGNNNNNNINRSNYNYYDVVNNEATSSQNQSFLLFLRNNKSTIESNYNNHKQIISDNNNTQQQQPTMNRGIYEDNRQQQQILPDPDFIEITDNDEEDSSSNNNHHHNDRASTVKMGTSTSSGGQNTQSHQGTNNGTTKAERDTIVNVSSTGVRPTMAFTKSYFHGPPRGSHLSEADGDDEDNYGNHDEEMMQSDQSHHHFTPERAKPNKAAEAAADGTDPNNKNNNSKRWRRVSKRPRVKSDNEDSSKEGIHRHSPQPWNIHLEPGHTSHGFLAGAEKFLEPASSNPTEISATSSTSITLMLSTSGRSNKKQHGNVVVVPTTAGGGSGIRRAPSSSSTLLASPRNDAIFFSFPPSTGFSGRGGVSSSSSPGIKLKSIKATAVTNQHLIIPEAPSSSQQTLHNYQNENTPSSSSALSNSPSVPATLSTSHHYRQHSSYPRDDKLVAPDHHHVQQHEEEEDFGKLPVDFATENEVLIFPTSDYEDQVVVDEEDEEELRRGGRDDDDVVVDAQEISSGSVGSKNMDKSSSFTHNKNSRDERERSGGVNNDSFKKSGASISHLKLKNGNDKSSSAAAAAAAATDPNHQQFYHHQQHRQPVLPTANFPGFLTTSDNEALELTISNDNEEQLVPTAPVVPGTSSTRKSFQGGSSMDNFEQEMMQGDDPSVADNPLKNGSSAPSSSAHTTASTFNSSSNGKQRSPLQIRRDLSRLVASQRGNGINGGSSVIGADDEPMPNKCDRLFMSSGDGSTPNGTFESPTMISEAGHLYQCIFMFIVKPTERVEVVFTQFSVRGTPPECVHEWVDIWTEVEGTDPTDLVTTPFSGRYCGRIPPRRRISLYGGIAIGFYSDKNSTDETIFRGLFSFINDSPYQIGTPVPRTLCSYTILGASKRNGDLISPTYPGVYPKNLSCSYKFIGIEGQRIRLEFRDFDVFYGGAHCPFDEVKVYDGMDPTAALIGTYCGQQRNLVVFSSTHLMLVTFTTLDRSTEAQNRGFKGVWEFSESFVKLDFIEKNMGTHIRGTECDQRILSKGQSAGVVYSPNYPFPYVPKIVCRYFIYGLQDPQHLERVRLSFEKFDVITSVNSAEEDTTNQSEPFKKCGDGFLKVYLKGQEVIQAYDKADFEFCGKDVPHDVVSDGPRLVLVFSSGEAVGSGFKARYQFETEYRVPGTAAPDGSCHFTYYSTSRMKGEFNSPRFPTNYPSTTNCTYIFFQQPNEQVRIVFDNFKMKSDKFNYTDRGAYGDLCEEDWVEIWNVIPDADDRLVGRYCGLTAPGPIESLEKASALKVILHTDEEGVSSGFKARYIYFTAKTIFGECGQNITQAQSGVLTSPKWPQKYDGPSKGEGSATCNWYLSVRPGSRVMLHFQNFAIEGEPNGRGCPAAAVRIWIDPDGVPVELCGESLVVENSQYVSARNVMRVTFITADKAVGAPGFRAVWTEVQEVPRISSGAPCHHSYFRCMKSLFCIPADLRCDGVENCGTTEGEIDMSDEEQCGLEFGDMNTVIAIIVGVAISLFFIVLLCAWGQRRKRRRRRRLQLRRPPIHVCDNAGARFAAMDSV